MSLDSTDGSLRQRFGTLLLDLDGVVYRGPNAVPHAVDALAAARSEGSRLAFVTNNAARTPDVVAEHLSSLGVPADPGDVVTSSHAVATLLSGFVEDGSLTPGAKVLVVGQAGLRDAVADAGFTLVESADDRPVVVVQGFGPDTGWRQLAEATYAIAAGARWIASNLDKTLPTERGLAPGNGSMVAAVATATGGGNPQSAGKPARTLFDTALERLGAVADDTLVVGDRLDSDIEGAVAADLPGLLVLTGVSTIDDLFTAPEHQRPRYVGFDLRTLADEHPPVSRREDTVACARWSVHLEDGRARLDGAGSPTAALRAATVAAWTRPDSDTSGLRTALDKLRP
ncbi:MAG TPA: HAD-IIA family hydrolase [Actinopolymorphaceae bacterium]